MKKLRMTLMALAASFIALPAVAAEIPLSRLSAYLNGLTTAQGDFRQINADGSVSGGRLYIQRPGRARFEYAAPNDALVMAGGGQVAVFDPKSNQPPEQYPLARTPLNLILARNINLGDARMVVGHMAEGDMTAVVAQDPEHPEYGTIRLVFADNPVRLRKWVITDEAGGITTVELGTFETGMKLAPSLFNIVLEARNRAGD
ncbi:MAG: outer membrane lipoprotein carrier protein LolA [Confluentimicrobium sp.]|jgi:outer membrane lipoprotein-sorting protein|uniref:LolA family protein n=1 Tax=Actibacterium sp. TaxID=1872125 RepID=UPI00068C7042|nr:outer membrane lipoprotein carrier protein LolA [Actibacterium sp.]MBC55407.1 outer membrane lipoprotein carrier protein LolA [Actibacterium sp.]MDY6859883.1 outer membrane lipoprotein carrier protein LolA [Pseudomonadota bacterium]|tara:strand:- start:5049 stop:5654 length:606 start_codon:yes stop_codon:yes gene_type:complete